MVPVTTYEKLGIAEHESGVWVFGRPARAALGLPATVDGKKFRHVTDLNHRLYSHPIKLSDETGEKLQAAKAAGDELTLINLLQDHGFASAQGGNKTVNLFNEAAILRLADDYPGEAAELLRKRVIDAQERRAKRTKE
jgi:hypothetical protein